MDHSLEKLSPTENVELALYYEGFSAYRHVDEPLSGETESHFVFLFHPLNVVTLSCFHLYVYDCYYYSGCL